MVESPEQWKWSRYRIHRLFPHGSVQLGI
jgi:hypothetical protein